MVTAIKVPYSNVQYNLLDQRTTELATSLPIEGISDHVAAAQVYMSVHYQDRQGYRRSAEQSEYHRWCVENTRLYLCGQLIAPDGVTEAERYADAAKYLRGIAFSESLATVRNARETYGIVFKGPRLLRNDEQGVFEARLKWLNRNAFYAKFKATEETPAILLVGRLVEVVTSSDAEGETALAAYLEAQFGS